MQVDEKERGFSFLGEGPLDMRMDPNTELTAEQIVNTWPEDKLGAIFKEYGEEPKWRKIAKAIVASRRKKRIKTAKELCEIIFSSIGGKKRSMHPATLIFQALRIAVNDELRSIEEGLKKALHFLAPGGKIGVLSFQRLEDRIVKNIFKTAAQPLEKIKRDMAEGKIPQMKILTKRPLTPSLQEIRANRRCRSAKLRFAQKLPLDRETAEL
jgi:16S rRNA (cytosine1402-N4)-methyltransferase